MSGRKLVGKSGDILFLLFSSSDGMGPSNLLQRKQSDFVDTGWFYFNRIYENWLDLWVISIDEHGIRKSQNILIL